MASKPYNPLDKIALAKSIEGELLRSPAVLLANRPRVSGAGVYAIYYIGNFAAYSTISSMNTNHQFQQPIYVGKAIPKGGRKGGLSLDSSKGNALESRLAKHASSIGESQNLHLDDFYVRHLVVDDIWIPLGENILIETFQPLWNVSIDGFGNNDPGRRRATQYRSAWDVVHPGRSWAQKLANNPSSAAQIIAAAFGQSNPTPTNKPRTP